MPIDAWDPATTQHLREIFAEEAAEHLAVLGDQLARLASDPTALQEALRRAHTLKGSSATVGFFCLQRAAHRLEESLVRLRGQERLIDEGCGRRLLDAVELLAPIVAADELSAAEALAERFAVELDEVDHLLEASRAVERKEGKRADAETFAQQDRRRVPERRSEDLSSIRLGVDRVESLMGAVGDLLVDRTRIERRAEEIAGAAQRLVLLRQALHSSLGEVGAPCAEGTPLPAIDGELEELSLFLQEAAAGLFEDSAGLGRKTRGLRDELAKVRMMSVGWLFARLRRQLRDVCHAEGKEVELSTEGDQIEIDRVILERITEPMIHLLANAVAHGVERPDVRRAAGKAAMGKVRVSARQVGEYLLLSVDDDGAGIDLERVRAEVEERGLSTGEGRALDDDQILDAIFLPGLTTRSEADQVAGRGVGLDVVRRSVAALGGDVRLRSSRGVGTSFSIRLPLTSTILRVMVVAEAGESYAIPLSHVTEARIPDNVAWREVDGVREVETRGGWLPVVRLCELLGVECSTDAALLALEFGTSRFVLACEQIRGPREAMLKPLGPILGRVPILSGAIVGRGAAIHFVLDVAGIYQLALKEDPAVRLTVARRVLLVDDSAAVREVVGAMLRDAGYLVDFACDGAEAWERLLEESYDLMLTDLEMPRLHGLALIKKCRQRRHTAALPILVLSSRTALHNRQEVEAAGASGFLGKPVNRQSILLAVAELLGPALS